MHEMVAADAVSVAVAGNFNHIQLVVGQFYSAGNRKPPPMEPFKPVCPDEVRCLRAAADARNEHRIVLLQLKLGDRVLDGAEYCEVTASWTPCRRLFCCQPRDCCHFFHL